MLDAVSAIEAPFHGSGGFYLRVSALGLVAVVAFGFLALRLWSLQVLRGPHFASAASRQSFRVVELPAARGAIVDAKGRTLVTTQGQLALTADPDTLGEVVDGRWRPTAEGRRALARVARLSGDSVPVFVGRIRNSLFRSPYAPVQIVPRLSRRLDSLFFEENAADFPGFATAPVPLRSYPQGALGSEFLGLLGEVGPDQLKRSATRGRSRATWSASPASRRPTTAPERRAREGARRRWTHWAGRSGRLRRRRRRRRGACS